MSPRCLVLLLIVVALAPAGRAGTQDDDARLPDRAIEGLRAQLDAIDAVESTVSQRRALKRVARDAESLLARYADSPDRFGVLGVIFDTQRALFTLKPSREAGDELIATATQLLDAPDELADVRLAADAFLVQGKLATEQMTDAERAIAVAELADRYRNTPGEAQSLMLGSLMAFELGHAALLGAFRKALSTRFGQDPRVIAFMRDRFAFGNTVRFGGTYQTAEGESVCFPTGRTYVVVFWSRQTPSLERKVAEVAALQKRFPGQFGVFSFNLDELPDSGRSLLGRMKLDWTPMRLPGGAENPMYLSVKSPQMFCALVVDPYGWAPADATGRSTSIARKYEAYREQPRQLALLHALSIGDYLVRDVDPADARGVGERVLAPIQACFVSPPRRYRLTPEQELANYQAAERLCRDAIAGHAGAPGLWVVHNRRTIALLGLWRLTGKLAHIEAAVASARAALAMKLPAGAATVPRFCLAVEALRDENAEPGDVLTAFIEACGGVDAPGAAIGAAMMLAIDAHSRVQFTRYRNLLMTRYAQDPLAWPVAAFCLDESTADRLFGRSLPYGMAAAGTPPDGGRVFDADWLDLDGDAITAIAFMEPTDDVRATADRGRVMRHLLHLAGQRPLKDLRVVGVVRSADAENISAMMKREKMAFPLVELGEADWRRAAQQLGLFSTDVRPNVFMVRPDGTFLLALSGVSRDAERPERTLFRFESSLRRYGLMLAGRALAEEDYETYIAQLLTSFPLAHRPRERYEPDWYAPNAHRRDLAWAYMQTRQWDKALAVADASIKAHEQACAGCDAQLVPLLHRANTLKRMGKAKQAEAAEALALFNAGRCPPGSDREVRSMFPGRRMDARTDLNDRLRFIEDYMRYDGAGQRHRKENFSLASDLVLRAAIEDRLGRKAEAARDRRRAKAIAWPYEVPMHDPRARPAAGAYRRALARAQIDRGEWRRAVDNITVNIEAHEAAPRAMGRYCMACAMQAVPMKVRFDVLTEAGRAEEAADAARLLAALSCPPGTEARPLSSFPWRYYPRGKATQIRLDYIENYMRSNAGKPFTAERFNLAKDLSLRAEALEALGEADAAAHDRLRARALLWPLDLQTASSADSLPDSYVSVVDTRGGGAE